MNLETRYRGLLERIGKATLIAVSKKQSLESIEELYRLGHRDFGENYVQELEEKSDFFLAKGIRDIRWHFIGHLQTNKVKNLLPLVHTIHTIDSLRLAKEIDNRSASMGLEAVPCFIEVNLDQEESKSGLAPKDVVAFSKSVAKLSHISLMGLMAIPKPGSSADGFKRLNELEALCRPNTKGFLSMGMSDDYEDAIKNGATHIRVGTALFGSRN